MKRGNVEKWKSKQLGTKLQYTIHTWVIEMMLYNGPRGVRGHYKGAKITGHCPSVCGPTAAHRSCFSAASSMRTLVNFISPPCNLPSTLATLWPDTPLRLLNLSELKYLKCPLCLLLLCPPPPRPLFLSGLPFFPRVLISQHPLFWLKCLPILPTPSGLFSTCQGSCMEAMID